MKDNVLNYEPHLALFVEDEDALLFYRKIIELSDKLLNSEGLIYFEINESQGDTIKKVLGSNFANIQLRQDIYGKDRMIKAERIRIV